MKAPFKKGFTLLELLLVVAIIAILGITSTVFYARFMTQSAVDNTSDQLAGSLRKAQMYSMMGKYKGTNNDWGVRYGSNTITLFLSSTSFGDPYANRNTTFDEVYTIQPNIAVTGLTQLIFTNATGVPSATATITITGGNTVRTITVNSQGVVSR